MDSLNIGNHSKTLAFKKFEHLLYKCYPKFVKTLKKHPNKFDIRQFLVFLYDCVPNMKNYCRIDRLLENFNVLQAETGKNPTAPLHSEHFLNEINKNNKVLQVLVM